MRTMPWLLLVALTCVTIVVGDEPAPKANPEKDYAEFSKLIHHVITGQLKKEYEYRDNWGNVIPLPDKRLPLPKLRTYLKDGDQVVLPHGAWKKLKARVADPARDLKIQVKDFKPLDGKTYRLALDADVALATEGEWQQWQKGLLLVGIAGEADAFLRIGVVCDVGVQLDFAKLPPEIKITPKIAELALDLKDIRPRGGPLLTGERGEKLAADIKGLLRSAVKLAEPHVKELANDAIAKSLKDGKGALSAGAILKALPKK
jgi:hypothetical protein